MSRVRVLRVITRLNVGGPSLNAALLATRMDSSRFETLLVAGRESEAEGSMLELGRLPSGLDVIRVDSLGREISPLDDLRALAAITRIARRFRPHVVHTHLAKAGFVGRLAGRAAGAPVIVHTFHGSVFRGYFGERQSALFLLIERALALLSTRLIAITPLQRRELAALGVAPLTKIVEIPLGLDLTQYDTAVDRAAARNSLGVRGDGPVVGIVGRLVPIKDVGTFLRALALLRERAPDTRALVVGDGDERPALERLAAELGLADTVTFTGWRSDMPAVFAAIDVLALTSLNEGSPVTLIEGLAARRAIVATAVGGVPDVIREGTTGLLVPPRDPRATADAVAVLLADASLRSRLGDAGRAEVTARYDSARLVADVERLYLELLGARAP